MVYSAGAYGDGAFNDIQRLLRTTAADYGICLAVAVRIPLSATATDYDYAVKQLLSEPAARVVLIYLNVRVTLTQNFSLSVSFVICSSSQLLPFYAGEQAVLCIVKKINGEV